MESNRKDQEKQQEDREDPDEPDEAARKPSAADAAAKHSSVDDARKPIADAAKKPSPDESKRENEADEDLEETDEEEVAKKPTARAAASRIDRASSLDSEAAAPPKRGARKRMRTSETGEEIRVSHQQRWEEMFERLKEFKRRHGHCRVPNRYPEDTQLGSWVSAQRRQYRIVTQGEEGSAALTPERANQLIGIGFEWTTMNPHHTPWETRYEALKEFVRRFGHAEVPMRWHEDPKLSHWVSKQRSDYKLRQEGKTSRLTDDRLALLNSIGFRWEGSRRSVAQKMRGAEAYGDGEGGTGEALALGGSDGYQMEGGVGSTITGAQAPARFHTVSDTPSSQNGIDQARQQFLSQLPTPPAAQGNAQMGQLPTGAAPIGLQQLLAAFAPRGGMQPQGFAASNAGGQNAANVQQISSLLSMFFPQQSVAAASGATTNLAANPGLQAAPQQFFSAGAPQPATTHQSTNTQQQHAQQPEPRLASQQQPEAPQLAAPPPPRQQAPLQSTPQQAAREGQSQQPQPHQPQQPAQQLPAANNLFLQQIMSLLGTQQPSTNAGIAFNLGGAHIQSVAPNAGNVGQQAASLLAPNPQVQINQAGLQAFLQQAFSQPQMAPQAGLQYQNNQHQPPTGNNAGAAGNQAPQYLLVVPLNGLSLPQQQAAAASNPAMPIFALNPLGENENANGAVSSLGQASGSQDPTPSSTDNSAGAGTGAPPDPPHHNSAAESSGGSEGRESESDQSNASPTTGGTKSAAV